MTTKSLIVYVFLVVWLLALLLCTGARMRAGNRRKNHQSKSALFISRTRAQRVRSPDLLLKHEPKPNSAAKPKTKPCLFVRCPLKTEKAAG